VGQEGLDFHSYCHAVVHWNLPPNPVDLEQREGRVHRYKGHAIRKNVATKYGLGVVGPGSPDPWQALFDRAKADRAEEATDLIPYWTYPIDGGAQIERHVPSFPLSKDRLKLEALRRSLVVYRMAFGQPRQDDLVEYLLSRMGPDEAKERMRDLQIDLSPTARG
jgi:hypothetical protein